MKVPFRPNAQADAFVGRDIHVLSFADETETPSPVVVRSALNSNGYQIRFGNSPPRPADASASADGATMPGVPSALRSARDSNGHGNGHATTPGADRASYGLAPELLEIGKHFDADYYATEYPDLALDRSRLLTHYCSTGWREGRNPNPFFDTVSYLLSNADVAASGINPFFHYLTHGLRENRVASSSISPSIRSRLLFGAPVEDWVERLRPHLDIEFYSAQLDNAEAVGLDLTAHFAFRGWREGKSPNSSFDVRAWLSEHPAAMQFAVNPLLIHLEVEKGNFQLELMSEPDDFDSPPLIPQCADNSIDAESPDLQASDAPQAPTGDGDQLNLVRPAFDAAYYLACYPDVAEAGIDPLLHFFHTGWREGRNPSLQFDTKYYLQVNADVRDAGLNPLWHFLTSGRAEGRLTQRPGGYRRQIIDAAIEPAKRPVPAVIPKEKLLGRSTLARKLAAGLKRRKGMIVSLSHDCYIRVIGGTQIFIADEQSRFNKLDYAYVHISPQIARLMLVERNRDFLVRIVVDGVFLGLASISTLNHALKTIRAGKRRPRSLMVVHSILGFHVPDVIGLCAALKPERRVFWIHDFSSVCEGFNLLRNDAQFCGGPPETSFGCRICVYGKSRPKHRAAMRSLFEACRFDVVSPSSFALDLWLKTADLPRNSATVHPHWKLIAGKATRKKRRRNARKDRITVAFVGFPSPNKGWPLFSEIVQRLNNDPRYQFYHFAAKGTSSLPHVKFVRTEVTPKDRFATSRLLAEAGIDLVVLLSLSETFSFVAHEAIAAGATIVCLADSGNVAALVQELQCGHVFADAASLIEFLEPKAAEPMSAANGKPRRRYQIEQTGTTATLKPLFPATAALAP
jgi:glycosyltransferase involved in cell wall biosynthesis